MNLNKQKELISRAVGVSKYRIKLNPKNPDELKSLKEVISREGARDLLKEKVVIKKDKKGNSKTRVNKIKEQKKKGRMSGQGSRKGTKNARFPRKEKWIIKIRGLRALLKKLRGLGNIEVKTYREYYRKAKGNMFRNKKHLMLILEQNNLFKENKEKGKK